MFETIEIAARRAHRTIKNARNGNRLAEDLENLRAFCDGLISSHRIELDSLRSTYAANLALLKKESNESHSNERAA
jgi:hypothetical protein